MATPLPYLNNNTNGCCSQDQCLDICNGGDDNNNSSSKPDAVSVAHHLLHLEESLEEMKSTEDFLASELTKLSVQERNKALDDLHCVGEDLTETPELIETSLQELDRILKEWNEPIYNVAEGQNRAYVEDRDFRLRFLRANYHDAENAANQMIGFLTQKEIYFGRDKIARDITLDDLDEEAMNVLLCGRFHIQDALDRKGRHVVWFFNHAFNTTPESICRANYIVYFNILSPLASVQTKGVAVCYYDMVKPGAPTFRFNLSLVRVFMAFMTTVPVRRTGLHICLKKIPGSHSFKSNWVMETVFKAFEQAVRVRVRMHYGSDIELQYKLRNHGLPMVNVPVDTHGNLRNDILNVWFYSYLAKERNQQLASSAASHLALSSVAGEEKTDEGNHHHGVQTWNPPNYVPIAASLAVPLESDRYPESAASVHGRVEPTDKDVLLGRGRGNQLHPGNVRFREYLKEYQNQYNHTRRYQRVRTSTELTRLLLADGVRFLKKAESGDGWVIESDFSEAEKKVKQFFRSQKKLIKTTAP